MEESIRDKIYLLHKDKHFLSYINLLIDNKMKEADELYNEYFKNKVNNERLINDDKKFILLIHRDCYGRTTELFGIFKSPNKEFLIEKLKNIYSDWENNDIFRLIELETELDIDLLDIEKLNNEKLF